jgi:hypothetical protein
MTFTFRKAITSEAKPLIGLYAESGCGKTKSALLVAKGFAGDMAKVGMIETESGRGEAYADDPMVGGYQVLPLREEFSPASYGKAINAAEKAGLQALIVDSASHEWEGIGGVLSMAAANQAADKKGPIVWQKPKIEHQREFMLRLLQTPIPLVIVCMRAKYPMQEATAAVVSSWSRPGRPPKVGDWFRSDVLSPKQSDDILFEMFVHGWIDQQHRFHGTKYTLEVLRKVLVDNEPLGVETGPRLAAWASARPLAPTTHHEAEGYITTAQQMELEGECLKLRVPLVKLLAKAEVDSLDKILAGDFARALAWIGKHKPVTDEADTLRKIDAAATKEKAAEILDLVRGTQLEASATEAFANRWGAT